MSRISVECPTHRTVLFALYRQNANTPAQDRSQLCVTELVKGAVVVDRRVDYLHGLAFEAVGDLLECPGFGAIRFSSNDERAVAVCP